MAGMTRYLQKKLLDHFINSASYTAPTTLYVSLHTASPGEAGSHSNEIGSGVGYSRQTLTGNIGTTDLSTGIASSTTTITFGPATSDWGTVNYIGIEEAPSGGSPDLSNNMLMFGAPTTAKTIVNGQSFTIAIGQISLQFD